MQSTDTGSEAVVLDPDEVLLPGPRGCVGGSGGGGPTGGPAGGVYEEGAESLRVGPGDESALRRGDRQHAGQLEGGQLRRAGRGTVDLQLLTRLNTHIGFIPV